MTRAAANGIDIEYDTFGDKNATPLLLIMGLSSQMVAWPESFCEKLAQNGHWVLRFDNRDVGLSSKSEGIRLPDLMAAMAAFQQGLPVDAPYTISDMAADAVGLMDALQLEKAHTRSLASVTAPTLVIHGADDPLVPPAHGRATARAIPGAKLLVVEGLGHGIAYPALWDEIVDAITQHTSAAWPRASSLIGKETSTFCGSLFSPAAKVTSLIIKKNRAISA